MGIITGKNNESFGFIQEGCFSNRLYIFENANSDEERVNLQKNALQLPGAGITSYGDFIGFILSCLSLASTIQIGDETLYINNQSFCHYILRKGAHKGNRIAAMHEFYVKNKSGVERSSYNEATLRKISECFFNQIKMPGAPVELWELIETCIKASFEEISIDSNEDEESFEDNIPQVIEKFIKHFLWPYITNQIDPDSPEEINREPMFKILMDHLEEKFGIEKESNEFEEIALNNYILAATEGLFQNRHIATNLSFFKVFLEEFSNLAQIQRKKDEEYHELMKWYFKSFKIEPELETELDVSESESETTSAEQKNAPRLPSKECLILLQALCPALEKDFPRLTINTRELVNKIYDVVQDLKEKQNNDPIAQSMRQLKIDSNWDMDERDLRKRSLNFKAETALRNLRLAILYPSELAEDKALKKVEG